MTKDRVREHKGLFHERYNSDSRDWFDFVCVPVDFKQSLINPVFSRSFSLSPGLMLLMFMTTHFFQFCFAAFPLLASNASRNPRHTFPEQHKSAT